MLCNGSEEMSLVKNKMTALAKKEKDNTDKDSDKDKGPLPLDSL